MVFCYVQSENNPSPLSAVSYLFAYLLPDGNQVPDKLPGPGTRVTFV